MQQPQEEPARAVIIGAGKGGSAILEMLLEEDMIDIVAIVDTNPDAPGLRLAQSHQIPVFNDMITALKQHAPCIAFNMTGNEMVDEVAAKILGAGGVIGGIEARLIWRIISNLKKTKEELQFIATHDALTGLYNRHFGLQQLHKGVAQAIRYRFPYSLVMLDIDHFKTINDQFGHPTGDAVLREVSAVLRNHLRDSDIPCRWGGEEFLVLLPHTPIEGATLAAQNWLRQVRRHPVHVSESAKINLSFSAGVTGLRENSHPNDLERQLEWLLHDVDQALYQAKRAGRNRVLASQAT